MSQQIQAPIAACSDWDSLLAAVRDRAGGEWIALAPKQLSQAVLAAPAAVARWIAERAPGLLARARLRLLVVGAEKLDAVDDGRWYQLVPLLLGRELALEVTLVGDRLAATARSALHAFAPRVQARLYTGSLADYLAGCAPAEHDLVFLFHPGFQKHRGWLGDSGLAALLARGATLVAAAYGEDESEVDRWVVESHGYSTDARALLNPFYVDLSDAHSALHWARALWQFGDRIPRPGVPVDHPRLERLDRLSRMVMHSMVCGSMPRAAYGAKTVLRAGPEQQLRLIYVFDEFFVAADSARIFALRAGRLEAVGILPAAAMGQYPQHASELERALWAAQIKAEHLLGHYPAPVSGDAGPEMTSAMYADLNQRVDALLQERLYPA